MDSDPIGNATCSSPEDRRGTPLWRTRAVLGRGAKDLRLASGVVALLPSSSLWAYVRELSHHPPLARCAYSPASRDTPGDDSRCPAPPPRDGVTGSAAPTDSAHRSTLPLRLCPCCCCCNCGCAPANVVVEEDAAAAAAANVDDDAAVANTGAVGRVAGGPSTLSGALVTLIDHTSGSTLGSGVSNLGT